jgi:hypothetical protein
MLSASSNSQVNLAIIDIDHVAWADAAKRPGVIQGNTMSRSGYMRSVENKRLSRAQCNRSSGCESAGSNPMPFKILEDTDSMTELLLGAFHALEQSFMVCQSAVGKIKPKDAHSFLNHS